MQLCDLSASPSALLDDERGIGAPCRPCSRRKIPDPSRAQSTPRHPSRQPPVRREARAPYSPPWTRSIDCRDARSRRQRARLPRRRLDGLVGIPEHPKGGRQPYQPGNFGVQMDWKEGRPPLRRPVIQSDARLEVDASGCEVTQAVRAGPASQKGAHQHFGRAGSLGENDASFGKFWAGMQLSTNQVEGERACPISVLNSGGPISPTCWQSAMCARERQQRLLCRVALGRDERKPQPELQAKLQGCNIGGIGRVPANSMPRWKWAIASA